MSMLVRVFLLGVTVQFANAGVLPAKISGQITRSKSCQAIQEKVRSHPQVWVSQGDLLIYQVEVPVMSDFEVDVIPGKYNVVATDEAGCFIENTVDAIAGKLHSVKLELAPVKRLPAGGVK